jgi:hypothetical protein
MLAALGAPAPAFARQDGKTREEHSALTDDVAHLSEDEDLAFNKHCEAYLGAAPSVLHELVSDRIHLDVLPYGPSAKRPYWTLVTMGASVMEMRVPAGVDQPRRMELMITLPEKWLKEVKDYATVGFSDQQWAPGGAMKRIARYVHEEETWFGYGHTLAWRFGEDHPMAAFKGFALAPPLSLPKEFARHTRPDGQPVAILALYPLYQSELDYKFEHGFDALFARWQAAGLQDAIALGRPSVV